MRITKPLHVSQASSLKRGNGVLSGLLNVRAVLIPVNARFFCLLFSLKHGQRATHSIGFVDLLLSRQHTVKHCPHFIAQLNVERLPQVFCVERVQQLLVGVKHPRAETLEHFVKRHAGGFAFPCIGLEPASELLVVWPLFFKRHAVPRGTINTKPLHDGVEIVLQHTWRR